METGIGSASVCPRKGESHSATAVSASINAHSGNVVAVAPIGSDEVAASEHEAEITAENEPPAKKQKKATTMVWQYFTKTWETKTGADGIEVKELWAKCKKCSYKGRAETTRGTKAFWNHVEYKHYVKQGQLTIKLEKNDDNAVVQAYRFMGDENRAKEDHLRRLVQGQCSRCCYVCDTAMLEIEMLALRSLVGDSCCRCTMK